MLWVFTYLYQLVAPPGYLSHSFYIPHGLLAMRGKSKCVILILLRTTAKQSMSSRVRVATQNLQLST